MWAALRYRPFCVSSPFSSSSFSSSFTAFQQWKQGLLELNRLLCSSVAGSKNIDHFNRGEGLLNLEEVEKVLSDVKADNVKVIPVGKKSDFADFMVVATGRSPWHVRNIAQALIYKVKQKQKGAKRMMLPSVEGQEEGKWIVIDSGSLIIHALDEKARPYYNLESLWSTEITKKEDSQDVVDFLVKVRRKNNSKKRVQRSS